MPVGRTSKVWTAVVFLLLVIIIIGAVIMWVRFPHSHPVEISIESPAVLPSGIYVDGAVNSPGFYPLQLGDNLDTLLQMAGGTTDNADRNNIRLYVPVIGETEQTQKININHAESWLLEALPGIGSTLGRRIIEYREQHGPFRNINELTMVDGITVSLYEKIKPLITVAD
jgi:competence protein ComEA